MKNFLLFVVIALLTLIDPSKQFLGNDIFSSKDNRLYEVFCVESDEQLAEIGRNSWTHESITREGIKKSIINYLTEISDVPFEVPADATLSEVFQAYYGECASPDRFLAAVQSIVDACIDLDSQPVLKEDPDLHFDAEHVPEGQRRLFERNNQINTVTTVDQNYAAARTLLGQSLHAIQKFYSHTSWIENGNTGIADLLTPGLSVPPNTTATCNNDCIDDCSNNLITDELTSGYFPFHNPPIGKCFHGGSLDDEYSGINKDTISPCYSPHFALHQTAANLAIKATESYVDQIRANIRNRDFAALFDMGNSSALAILLDTSSSMENEIEAVKLEIIQIIEEAGKGKVGPSEYFLAAFEAQVQFTRTKDPAVIIAAIQALVPAGGTENIYTAAQMVLAQAPPYTDILAFTDEPGDDEEQFQKSVINLAQDKRCKFNLIWTETLKKPDLQAPRSIEGLQETCRQTGGLFMESSKVDVYDIVALLSQSIESTKATLISIQASVGQKLVTFPVDNSLGNEEFRIGLTINGRLTGAFLTSPDGATVVNLQDQASIDQSQLDFNIVYSGDSLLTLTFRPNQVGWWNVSSTSTTDQEILVTASCTHNFIANFQILDLNTTHPNLRVIQGKPIANSSPLLSVHLTAASSTKIATINAITFITPDGEVLHTYRREDTSFASEFLMNLEEFRIPRIKFFIRLEGTDTVGNGFWRLLLPSIEPSSTSVEITASSSRIEAPPGGSTVAEYVVKNFGETTQVQIQITDDKTYLSSFTPATVQLNTNESASVVATFSVPNTAAVGTASSIVVTATSDLDGTQNYARSTLVVISNIEDTTKPNITVTSNSQCPDVSQATCNKIYWQFTAQTYDNESGLSGIRLDATGQSYNSSIPPFSVGSTDVVEVEFIADCCVRKSTMTVFDVSGNVNSVAFDLGPINECGRIHVYPVGITSTSAEIAWNRPCAFDRWKSVHHYEFTFEAQDGEIDVVKTSFCDLDECVETIFNLRSCIRYNMTLTAFQAQDETEGETEVYLPIIFRTLDEATSPPFLIASENITETSILLKWKPPTRSKECVHHYKICHREMPDGRDIEDRSVEKCDETEPITDPASYENEVEYLVQELQPCQNYRFSIVAFTSTGIRSKEATYQEETGFSDPSEPVDFRVVKVDAKEVTLCWNKPVQNSKCVKRYQTSFFKCLEDPEGFLLDFEDDTTTFGPEITTTTTTVPTTTQGPTTTTPAQQTTTTQIDTTTTKSSTTTARPTTSTTTPATTTTDPVADCDYHEAVGVLQACTCYNFSLSAVHLDGSFINSDIYVEATTILTEEGIAPPTGIHVEDIGQTSAYVGWFPPDEDFACVEGFEIEWFNTKNPQDSGSHTEPSNSFSMVIDSLLPCSPYNVSVKSVALEYSAKSEEYNFDTKDKAPGIATQLEVSQLYNDGFDMSWCLPIEEPQCATSWARVIDNIAIDDETPNCEIASRHRSSAAEDCQTLDVHSLECGTLYKFTLWASSPIGLEGPPISCKLLTEAC